MKLLMYYDGTDHSRQSLPVVRMRAKALNATVHVITSLSRWGEPDLREIDRRKDGLNAIKAALERENIACQTHLLLAKDRNAGDDIVEFASTHEVDEIIMGTDRSSGKETYVPGWLINHVIGRARCPVLII